MTLAKLILGHTREALSGLSATAQATNAAGAWSDVAAAYFIAAIQYDSPDLFASALSSCDRALEVAPRAPEPRFNRALILERLGLREDAREAWDRYLDVDATTGWAAEAREHLERLEPAASLAEIINRDYDVLSNEPAAATALARRDPQAARQYAWMEILGRWAKAIQSGNAVDAARHLRVARNLAASVAAINGDRMAAAVTASVEQSQPSAIPILAAAHIDYRAGITAFQNNRPVDAEAILRRSAAEFERAGSPMALNAAYFAANAHFEQGDHDVAQRQLETLLAKAPPEFPSYRAQVVWELGVCEGARGAWGRAIVLLRQSVDTYEQLGETQNAAAVRRALAFVFDRIGDPGTAWKERIAALRGMGGRSGLSLEKAVSSVAQEAILRREWHIADSFLTVEIGVARRLHDDVQLTDALLKRSAVRVNLGKTEAAHNDLTDASATSTRIKDPAYQEWSRVAQLRVRAMLTPSPAEAVQLLDQAIRFQAARSDPMNLPALYLESGRARRRAGDLAGAASDYRDGIAQLEQHRESLPQGDARWGAFHAAEELFDDGIDLAMTEHDAPSAFAIAERARARTLLDTYGHSPAVDYKALPANTAVIEYASLPARLIIFTVRNSGIRATVVDCERETVTAEAETLSAALRSGNANGWKTAARKIGGRLVAPIAAQLAGASTIIFIPDAATATVPFNALLDSDGTALLERYAIVVSPSAAVYAAATAHHRMVSAPKSVLIVANNADGGTSERLPFVGREAEQIARTYPRSKVLQDAEATLEQLSANAATAEVIHFAGHALGDESGFEPASIVLRKNGAERRVRVADIAKLRLSATSVVVLSGCSTARGERRAAEGVISVAHGFLTAGAPSVIATLWPIDDEAAAALFPRLHRHLASGMSPAEALRAVQLEALHDGSTPASLWAALQDIGI
jgi:CHAT domain-containing protein